MSTRFIDEDKVRNNMSFLTLLKKLWPMTWKYKKQVVLICIYVALFSIVGRLIPYLFSVTVDKVIGEKNKDWLLWLVAGYAFLEISRAVLNFFLAYGMEKLGNRVLFDLRERLIAHTQSLPLRFFDRNPAGRLVTRLTNDVLSIGDLYSQGFTAIFLSFIELITIAAAMILLSPRLGIATLAMAPLAIIVTGKISLKLRNYFGEAKKKMAQMNAFTAESLNGMKVLRLFDQTSLRNEQFQKHSNEYLGLQIKTIRYFAMLWPTLGFFNVSTVAISILLGAYWFDSLSLTIGQLTAFILYVQGFYAPIRVILEQHNQFQNSLASADRLFHLLDEVPEPKLSPIWPNEHIQGKIEIHNLSFYYGDSTQPALKNISMSISPGDSVAFVGRTGSGKTTTISLLQRLYEIQKGEIHIDEVNISTLNLDQLRSRIGIIQQDNFIFRGSLYDNISLNNANISRETALWALKKARCTRLLVRTNENLDYQINERGSNLSLGERQLLAFARILAFNPDILILDEATANVDSESERDLQIATEEVTAGRTCILVAHRLSTVINCDKIYVFEKGEIIESGNHTSLLAQRGIYYQMYRHQALDQDVSPDQGE